MDERRALQTPRPSGRSLILLLVVLAAACGGGTQEVRAGLGITARALKAVDRDFAARYEVARVAARESSETWEERDRKLVPWERARTALEASSEALYTTEAAVDATEAGFASELPRAAGCLADALGRLGAALVAVGYRVPWQLDQAQEALRSWAEPCGGSDG